MRNYARCLSGAALLTILIIGASTLSNRQVEAQSQHVAAQKPFQALLQKPGNSSITLPNDQRLTIEFVTASCGNFSGPATNGLLVSLQTQVGGDRVRHFFAPKFLFSPFGVPTYATSDVVRIYADPGTKVEMFIDFPDYGCDVSLSGYLPQI